MKGFGYRHGSDFLASDFIHEDELGPLLKEAERGGVTILWVPIYASAYKQTALEKYQAVLDPNKPLGSLSKAKRNETWVKICEEIERAVNASNVTLHLNRRLRSQVIHDLNTVNYCT